MTKDKRLSKLEWLRERAIRGRHEVESIKWYQIWKLPRLIQLGDECNNINQMLDSMKNNKK